MTFENSIVIAMNIDLYNGLVGDQRLHRVASGFQLDITWHFEHTDFS